MKFLSYMHNNIHDYGFLNDDESKICSIKKLFRENNLRAPSNLLEFIINYEEGNYKKIMTLGEFNIELSEATILPPFKHPYRNVICLGKNYIEHINEVKGLKEEDSGIPEYPIYFTKLIDQFSGPNTEINISDSPSDKVDYEVELALIIGKKCKNIKKEDAQNYIFGYTIGNDFSARDLQKLHSQWFKGKSLDGFCSIGPYIVTFDEIGLNPKLRIGTKVNGEVRQNSNTDLLIFAIDYILEDLSKGTTLFPGDIILTGTPSGVGMGFKPSKFLKPGDEVVCEIEKIGKLRNIMK